MVQKLSPPEKQDTSSPQYWSWLHKLWYRASQPGQISGAQIAFSGTNVVLGHGTSATGLGEELSVSGSAPINIAFGTGTITVSHNTSGVASGTYGGTAGIPRFSVNTTGHVTFTDQAAIAASAPITIGTGTATMTWGHATSGVVTGTYGGATIIPQIGVNTTGHVTVVNTFGLTGTAVAGADITLTSPIIFSSGTGTNAVLRAVALSHATSGIVAGTFGAANIMTQHVVNTYGHVTAVNTFGLDGTNVSGGNISLTSPIIFSSGTGTNAVLRNVAIAHGTSGIVPGTFGSASVVPQVVVDTYGHVTAVNTLNIGINGTAVTGADLTLTSPLVYASGTGTNILLRAASIAHATSGIVPGTFGGATVIPQVVVNTYGHVTAVNTFGLTGTAVAGADITLTSPIIFSSGTGTNAVLRAVAIAHGTSGIVPGTFGSNNIIPQVVVNTYGHVTAVNTFGLSGTSVSGADITLTAPIIFASGTGTNAVLRAVSISHGTSGVTPGTYGGTAGLLQIVVDTYGHVTMAVGTATLPSSDLSNVITGESVTMAGTRSRVYSHMLSVANDGTFTIPPTSYVTIAG